MPDSHLWETTPPLSRRCERGNYLAWRDDGHYNFETWADFLDFGIDDLVYAWRWDRYVPDPNIEEDIPDSDTLSIFAVQISKGFNFSCAVSVTEEDEPEITEWLTERCKRIVSIWQPVLDRALSELE